MNTKEFQNFCTRTVRSIDKKHKVKRDYGLSVIQLLEEIGELARCINSPKLRGSELNKENLEEEFADVLMQLFILAEMYEVDLEESVKNKIKILEKRHQISLPG